MALDVSTVGTSIVFSGAINLTVTEFSEEGTPFDAPDVDLSNNQKNLNGEMISSRTPSVYPFSVTVIPGSVADQKLSALAKRSSLQPGTNSLNNDNVYVNCVITIPAVQVHSRAESSDNIVGNDRKYSYMNARIKSAPTGPSSSAEGRQSARTYTFEAEGFDPLF